MLRIVSLAIIMLLSLVANLSILATPVSAKSCLTQLTAEVQEDNRIQLTGNGILVRVFVQPDNMDVDGRNENFIRELPANTSSVSFQMRVINPSRSAELILVVYDDCDGIWIITAEAEPTSLFDPYPWTRPAPASAPAQIPHR